MTVRFICADVLEGLAALPDESVHCVVTSPPYWGLRDYGTAIWEGGDHVCDHLAPAAHGYKPFETSTLGPKRDGVSPANAAHSDAVKRQQYRDICAKCGARRVDRQIGLEPTLDAFVAKMVEVFREVRRVLRKHGTLWLNMGDTYANDDKWGGATSGKHVASLHGKTGIGRAKRQTGFKPKDLMGMPWRVAFALQADGWWLRSDIIWSKPNPMPESVIDRPTKAHEYLFLLSKSARYFYDAEAIKETALWPDGPNAPDKISSPYGQGFTRANIGSKGNANTFRGGSYVNGEPGPRTVRGNAKPGKNETDHRGKAGFNARWDDAEAEGNAPASRNKRSVWTIATEPFPEAHFATFPTRLAEECIKAGCPVGGTVLDPFSGAGTTAMVADRRGRDAIGIELNPDYIAMAERRLARDRLERSQGTIADHDLVAEAAARRREAELAKLPPTPLEALMKGAVAPAGSGAPTRESEASAQ